MYYLGVDVGGTNLVAGIVDEEGTLLGTVSTPTRGDRPAGVLCEDIFRICAEVADKIPVRRQEIASVGMGFPGEINRDTGVVVDTPNAPFHNTNIRKFFQEQWNLPVYLENDGNCAAVGEYWAGAAKGSSSAIIVTLGTGIGGGILVGDRLLLGVNGAAGEIGHMVIETGGLQCNCGRKGCWETYASATGLIRMTRDAMKEHPESTLCATPIAQIEGRTAFDCARGGDATAKAVVARYVTYLAAGITNLVNIFQPQVICLGGGISNAPEELLLTPLRELVAQDRYTKCGGGQTAILRAALGNNAGIIGAAMLGKLRQD
ncbi:MAG: ROK family protein [Oscillospiraceae bacterium]